MRPRCGCSGRRRARRPPPPPRRSARPAAPPSPPALSIELSDELAHQLAGAALFDDPLFMSWIPEEDDLRRFALRVDEVATSKLYIDARQRQEAFENAAEGAAASYFTPQRRALYAKRLLEMAHVLASEQRPDAARTALAVSRGMEKDLANPFWRTPFALA